MPTSIVIGSGPGAAGAALALLADPSQRLTVLDIGTSLEPEFESARTRLASTPESAWLRPDLELVGRAPPFASSAGPPQKRAYGSDFPFRDEGQLNGVSAIGGANSAVISSAYGGFSNVWGAQVMPFSAATFRNWPFSFWEMEPHYRAALSEMSLAADVDDLAELFPLLGRHSPLPPLAARTQRVLDRYDARRAEVQSRGVTVGRARLAMRADKCTSCGLCMTGCPYGLIYSAAHTFDRLRRDPRVTYIGGVLALRIFQRAGFAEVTVRSLTSGVRDSLRADRVFVACGALGTTRLVLGSLGRVDGSILLQESVQFVMPAVSLRATPDPRLERTFTLNQFNVIFDAGDGREVSQVHFYPYNELFSASLPARLRRSRVMASSALKRLSVGFGYLPSWASPPVKVAVRPGLEWLPDLVVGDEVSRRAWPEMLKQTTRALVRVAPALDLWPVLPKLVVSPAAKSYHFGGSFPHGETCGELATDRLGRLRNWSNIHLVDASVFPEVPATTFTLTVMANAHRVASEAIGLSA